MNSSPSILEKISRWAGKHPTAVIAIFLLLTLGPFLDKAVHNDDPLYLWSAEQILKHPGYFYGTDVNWTGLTVPMSRQNWNPPAQSYFLAGVIAIFGAHEIPMHFAMLLAAFAAAMGIFQLARLWCECPLLAVLIAMSTPVFLVSATTLMCDLPMLAFWVWSMVLWERALKSDGMGNYLGAMLCAGLAVLSKYSALTLLPLLFALGLFRKKRFGLWLLWFVVPVVIIEGYELWTEKLYGFGLIAFAQKSASRSRFSITGGPGNKLILGTSYLGGCLLPVLFFARRLWKQQAFLVGGLLLVVIGLATAFWMTGLNSRLDPSFPFQMGVMLATAILIALLIVQDFWYARDTVSIVLAGWFAGVFIFAAILNWTISARSFLPLVPLLGILVVRGLARKNCFRAENAYYLPLAGSVIVSLLISLADLTLADSARTAARQLVMKYRTPSSTNTLWFVSHSGFQYYLQKAGARPVDFDFSILQPDDLVFRPIGGTGIQDPPAGDAELIDKLDYPTLPGLSTFNDYTGAGFYCVGVDSSHGCLPFVFGPVPAEQYFVFRILKTTVFTPPETLNNRAWQMATSPNAAERDGPYAVRLAEHACDLTHFQKTVYIGTLAAAYAEAGRFAEAIAAAQRAVALAQQNGETDLAANNRQLLQLYLAHKPFHDALNH